jgi:hypothetical protein
MLVSRQTCEDDPESAVLVGEAERPRYQLDVLDVLGEQDTGGGVRSGPGARLP